MNYNPDTSTDFNGQAQLKMVFPGTKFIPDKDPNTGVPVIDDKTQEYKSGTLVVTLYESVKVSGASPSIREVASVKQQVTMTKYRAIREDIDSLNVAQLKEYFPELNKEVTKPAEVKTTPEVEKLQTQVDDLTKQLAEALKLLTKKAEEPETAGPDDMETDDKDSKPVDKSTKKSKD